jgi:hypothetical protein
MAKITFLGENASGHTKAWGVHFPCGEAVSVDDVDVIEAAKRHPEFGVVEETPAKAENPLAERVNDAMRGVMATIEPKPFKTTRKRRKRG